MCTNKIEKTYVTHEIWKWRLFFDHTSYTLYKILIYPFVIRAVMTNHVCYMCNIKYNATASISIWHIKQILAPRKTLPSLLFLNEITFETILFHFLLIQCLFFVLICSGIYLPNVKIFVKWNSSNRIVLKLFELCPMYLMVNRDCKTCY